MRLYALSARDGSPRWTFESEDGFVKALYATDKVVSFIAYQDFASGVDAQTGELLWRKDTGNWVPSLSGTDNTVYFGSANTVVHALDMNTGEAIWTYNIGGDTFNYLLGAPVRVQNELYFLTQQGDIIALNASDGTEQWQMASGIAGARDGLTVSGGWIFIGDGEGQLYAYTSGVKES
jgi:outer membrane protein assembly factor BamB